MGKSLTQIAVENPGSAATSGSLIESVESALTCTYTAAQIVAAGWSDSIPVVTANFASTIEPVSLVTSVPGLLVTQVIYNTTDGKLYRWNGSAYTAAVAVVDLTGQITTTQITDGAISTPKIATGAVTANEIAANTITADKLVANSITAGQIAAGAIGATQIAAGTITATEIAAGTITVDNLQVGAATLIGDADTSFSSTAITLTDTNTTSANQVVVTVTTIGKPVTSVGAVNFGIAVGSSVEMVDVWIYNKMDGATVGEITTAQFPAHIAIGGGKGATGCIPIVIRQTPAAGSHTFGFAAKFFYYDSAGALVAVGAGSSYALRCSMVSTENRV